MASKVRNLADIRPMQAPERSRPPFTSADWLFEIKYDGWRMLAQFGLGMVELRTKGGSDCTKWFPEVVSALAKVDGGPYIVDGEACILDEHGRSDFDRFTERAQRRRYVPGTQVTYCVFDLLVEGSRNWMGEALVERKARLAQILQGVPKQNVLFVGDLPADESLYWAVVPQLELEGFMAKRGSSTYQQGIRSSDWLKLKRKGAVPPGRFRRKPAAST